MATDFRIPSVGQNDRPVEIKGTFDGDVRTTEIRVGGQLVTALAESSRSCFFISPKQNFGPIEIRIKENNVETAGAYRNIGVRLTSRKTNLLKGERTTVTIIVEGLKGIQHNVPMLLEKKGVVQMEGGDVQAVQIRPQDVRTDGTSETRRTLTELQAGGFGVTATVVDPAHRPIIIPLVENGKVNGFRVKKAGNNFVVRSRTCKAQSREIQSTGSTSSNTNARP